MSDIKKVTHPTAATVERVKAGAGLGRSSTSPQDDITAERNRQTGIAGFLSHGAENGLHLSDLVKLTGLPERTVRKMIHLERRRHIPILSNNRSGYFLPGSNHEKSNCVRSLRRRAAEILEAADGIEGADI